MVDCVIQLMYRMAMYNSHLTKTCLVVL